MPDGPGQLHPPEVDSLNHVLKSIAPGDLHWSVLEFHGIGRAPGGLSLPDFEAQARDRGYPLTWEELAAFARGVEQVWDCLIVGLMPGDGRSRDQLRQDDCAGACVVIDRQDVGNWEVHVSEPTWLAPGVGRSAPFVTIGDARRSFFA